MWCIPHLDDEFVERMEDVLELYEKALDPKEPVVCLDERPTPLRQDARPSKRCDNATLHRDAEYKRKGVANIFGVVEPRAGRHLTRATKDRKSAAFARLVRDIERAYPKAKTIHLVMDNLSTHTKNALIKTFGEREATRIWRRFSIHYTPKHGSWLNQAECELSIYVRQCLGKRRIESLALLKKETAAWNRHANRKRITIDWKFSVKQAREKFGYHGPKTSLSRH